MNYRFTTLLVPLLLLGNGVVLAGACPPDGYSRERLLELPSKEFSIADDQQRNALAIALLSCLSNSDPQLRDEVAFEALASWMRHKQISPSTARTILQSLVPWLERNYSDPVGVARPFAALVLSEVARMDRVEAFLSSAELDQLLRSATSFVASVDDYRGFDAKIGWRHSVAHGADLLLQLGLNSRLGKKELDIVLATVAAQIAPPGEHFYTYGEGERLARVVYYVAQRNLHSQREWRDWLMARASPQPWKQWNDVFASQQGLAKRHNTKEFMTALYVGVQENGDAELKGRLLQPLIEVLKMLP